MSNKRKPSSAVRQRIDRLERELAAMEAEIAQLEQNKGLGPAEDDQFALRKRATLFKVSVLRGVALERIRVAANARGASV
jgi:hypothetical protein